jgi:hypothetical protein
VGQVQPGEAEAGQGVVDAPGQGPVRLGRVLEAAPPVREPLDPRQTLGGAEGIGHRLAGVGKEALAEHADAALPEDGAGDGREAARDEPHQRGLAGTVPADQPRAFGAEGKVEAVEEEAAVRRGVGEVPQDDEGWHG